LKSIINFSGVTKKYPSGTLAVDNISFDIFENEIVGLLGPNGAGKTTIIKLLCSLTNPTEGEIYIYDKLKKKKSTIISVVLEGNRNLYWKLTVLENIKYMLALKGIKFSDRTTLVDELLTKMNIDDKKDALVGDLSRGMQQKVAVIIALIDDSKIILLDEPTLGLDVESVLDIQELIRFIAKEMSKSVIITSHDMRFIESTCARAIIINSGKKIAENTVEEFKTLFAKKSVKVVFDKQDNVEEKFEKLNVNINSKNDSVEVDFSCADNDDIFYEVMEALKDNKCKINDITYSDIDLETVFLEIIKNDRGEK
jgi:ABC-2 type transport system ATP-binding protein